jgi:molybdopterin biosynthesis enzyme
MKMFEAARTISAQCVLVALVRCLVLSFDTRIAFVAVKGIFTLPGAAYSALFTMEHILFRVIKKFAHSAEVVSEHDSTFSIDALVRHGLLSSTFHTRHLFCRKTIRVAVIRSLIMAKPARVESPTTLRFQGAVAFVMLTTTLERFNLWCALFARGVREGYFR